MAKVDREALLASMPDLAALLDRAEQIGTERASLFTPVKRAGSTYNPTKRVKSRNGYKGYRTVDWERLARNRRKDGMPDKPLICSKSYKGA